MITGMKPTIVYSINITSMAKMTPAMGVLKATMAAAEPQSTLMIAQSFQHVEDAHRGVSTVDQDQYASQQQGTEEEQQETPAHREAFEILRHAQHHCLGTFNQRPERHHQ
jgi:hypothetical protein